MLLYCVGIENKINYDQTLQLKVEIIRNIHIFKPIYLLTHLRCCKTVEVIKVRHNLYTYLDETLVVHGQKRELLLGWIHLSFGLMVVGRGLGEGVWRELRSGDESQQHRESGYFRLLLSALCTNQNLFISVAVE